MKEENKKALHLVKPCCRNCKFKCMVLFSEEDRRKVNTEFWQLDWKEKRSFIMNSTESKSPKRKTEGSKKK